MKKIGIITVHRLPNWGSALQGYALQKVVESLGFACECINYLYPNPWHVERGSWKRSVPPLKTRIARKLGLRALSLQQLVDKFVNSEIKESRTYNTFDDIKDNKYDGMIITGAPVEQLEFEEVDYWDELCMIMEWSKKNVYSTFHICWGAQAALYYHYGIKKYPLKKKMFGVFPHKSLDVTHPLMRGLDDVYYVPHSRHTETRLQDIALVKQLQVISYSEMSGVHIISDMDCRQFFVTGHSEYDRDTLAKEYFRDKEKGLDIDVPYNYFPNDNPKLTPNFTWRGHASLMYSNWLNFCVYQETPYDLTKLEPLPY